MCAKELNRLCSLYNFTTVMIQTIECDKSSAVLHRLPVRLVTRSGVKRKWAEQVPKKEQEKTVSSE